MTVISGRRAGFFSAHDGLKLYSKAMLVESSKASLVFVHGLGEHIGRYQETFQAFSEQGYSCYGYDQRGFGRSEGERGHVDAFSGYVEDLAGFIDIMAAEVPEKPVFLLGHSMGSIVALTYALKYPSKIQGLLIFSCPLQLAGKIAGLGRFLVQFWPVSLSPKLKLPNFIDPRMLSDNPASFQGLSADPYTFNQVSINWLREFGTALNHVSGQARQIKLPVLLNHGDQDSIAALNGAKSLLSALSSQDKTLHIYPGLKHELLNHTPEKRARVLVETFDWLARRS